MGTPVLRGVAEVQSSLLPAGATPIMTLRVVGAGLGRTGTTSLKAALDRLLGGPCYHMWEVFSHLEHLPLWHGAANGDDVSWNGLLDGYVATVDWPAAAFWQPLAEANPGSIVLLSTRRTPEDWWQSARRTIFANLSEPPTPEMAEWRAMWEALTTSTFTSAYLDPGQAMAAYERHNERVRAEVDPDRLLEWQPGDGWGPLCSKLDIDVPDEPFPHLNTTEEWLQR